MEENLPPGFRFHPTDEELITYYLSNKVSCFNFTTKAMADVDLNKCEPWDLPAKASMGEKEWYFFSLKDRKYPTGMRTNRATEAGYWKTTGKDKEIFQGRVLVGMKKTLVFYKGRAPKGEKTNWVMHEYRLESKLAFKSSQEEWVVCRVFQKSVTAKRPSYQTPQSPQSMESPCDNITSINANDFGDNIELLPNLNTIADSSFSQTEAYNNTTDALNVVNWNAIRDVANALPSITWPSSFLNTSLGINPFLLRALQLRNLQPRSEATDYSMISNGVQSNLGTDHLISSNFMASEVLDSVDQQQHQQQEQPYDLDSNIW